MNQQDSPVAITSARPARSVDIRRRQTRYLLSMGLRTICFVLAIVTTGPLRWSFVAGAVFLPYVAVVLANATDRREPVGPTAYLDNEKPLLEAPAPTSRRPR
ncbi:MAG: DUF3099 domain-containing protein [Nocardioidaceae bacterium]|nr:DUF3099 domain-containing protein [Nocardioidaceae bacterium]